MLWGKPAAEAPRWMLGDAGGGERRPGQAAAEITCQTRAQLVNLDVRERAADSLFSSVRVSRRRQDVRRMRATHRVSDTRRGFICMEEAGVSLPQHVAGRVSRRFHMCHVASQRAGDGSGARQRASTDAQTSRMKSPRRGTEATLYFCEEALWKISQTLVEVGGGGCKSVQPTTTCEGFLTKK